MRLLREGARGGGRSRQQEELRGLPAEEGNSAASAAPAPVSSKKLPAEMSAGGGVRVPSEAATRSVTAVSTYDELASGLLPPDEDTQPDTAEQLKSSAANGRPRRPTDEMAVLEAELTLEDALGSGRSGLAKQLTQTQNKQNKNVYKYDNSFL